MKVRKLSVKTKITSIASAIGFILLGANNAYSAVVVNGTVTHAPPGTIINTGTVGNTSAVRVLNDGEFIAEGDLTLSTKGQNSNGITISDSGGKVTANAGKLLINTNAFNSNGVSISNGGSANLSNGKIVTQGYVGNGLKIAGTGVLTATDLELETHGFQAIGAYVAGSTSSDSPARLDLTDSLINTFGKVSSGVKVENNSIANIIRTEINTQGSEANGLLAQGNGSQINVDQSSITTSGDLGHGIQALSGGIVTANNTDISTQGYMAFGLYAQQNSNITFSDGKITTDGEYSNGVSVSSGAEINVDNSNITTLGSLSAGVRSNDGTANIQNTSIITQGDGSYGIASNTGSIINAKDVTVQTSGGIESVPSGTTSAAIVSEFGGITNLTGSSHIKTSGANAMGLLSQVRGSGLADTIINAGDGTNLLTIDTTGADSFGIAACSLRGNGLNCSSTLLDDPGTADLESSSNAIININKAAITTMGENAYGLYTLGSDSSIVAENITATTQGESAHGVAILRGGEISLTDSTIKAQGNNATGASIVGSVNNDTTAALTLNNSILQSDQSTGIAVSSSNSNILMDHSMLSGLNTALLTEGGGVTTFDAVNGSVIVGNIDATSTVTAHLDNSKLDGDIISRSGNTNENALSINAENNSIITGSMTNVSAASLSNSQWNMTKSSTIDGLTAPQSGGLQLSNSQVNFVNDGQNYKTLTASSLSGNGTFVMNTELNDGGKNTNSDLLHITGTSGGDYNLFVNNTVGTGKQTVDDGIKLAQFEGQSNGVSVKLGNNLTAGAYEYLLYQGGSTDQNDWYLRSQLTGTTPTEPAPDSYNPSVPGYVVGPYLNRMYGFDTVGTLHERVGEQENLRKNEEFQQGAWGRISGSDIKSNAGRFGYDAQTWFAQLGSDLYQAYSDSGARTHAGVTATFGQVNTSTQDSLRSQYKGRSAETGSLLSKGYGLGAYYTRYAADSSYIDAVAQYTHYNNEYNSIYGDSASQNGNGMTLSVEVGKPFKNDNGWFIEPQAQIMYQYLHLNGVNDGVAKVSSINDNSGLARLGARIGYDSPASSKAHPYLKADVLSVIGRSPDVSVSNTKFNQNYDTQWAEFGGGFTGDITKNTSLYAELKYKKSFEGDMHGYSGNVGVRVNW